MSKPAKIAVLGNINQDFVIHAPRLPKPGETLLGDKFACYPGGKGANQAVAAARHGAQVTLFGRVGNDAQGEQVLANFKAEGIDISHITRSQATNTGVAMIILLPEGENCIITYLAANLECTPATVGGFEASLREHDLLLLQLGLPRETVEFAVETALKLKVPFALDPTPIGPSLPARWKEAAAITPNDVEATRLAGIMVGSVAQAHQACETLIRQGVPIVLLKMGGRGVVVGDASGVRHHRAPSVNVVDTTAAGDAFVGAFATRWCEGASVDEAVKFAIIAGALATTKPGAQPSLPTRTEVERFASEPESVRRGATD